MLKRLLPIVVIGLFATSTTWAQSAAHNVTIVVEEINEIAVSGDVTITINAAVPGGGPTSATAGATYDITTNGTGRKIVGRISDGAGAYSAGLTLEVNMAAPNAAATSLGYVTMTTADQDLVTGVTQVATSANAITLRATAAETVPPNAPGETREVTYTITT